MGARSSLDALRSPIEALLRMKELGVEVNVRLKDGTEYRGVIEDVDATMNLILAEAVQVSENGAPLVKYGRVFIRGSNILYVYTGEAGALA